MLFGRREAPTSIERLRVAIWPRRSWRRSIRYTVLRLERIDATPHALGLGLAIGVFAAFQPIIGFQMLFAGALAWLLGASVAAAMAGTFIGSPVTWPLMWLGSYEIGARLIGEERSVTMSELWTVLTGPGATASPGAADAQTAGMLFWAILKPLAVGAVPLGMVCGAIFYVMFVRAARAVRA